MPCTESDHFNIMEIESSDETSLLTTGVVLLPVCFHSKIAFFLAILQFVERSGNTNLAWIADRCTVFSRP